MSKTRLVSEEGLGGCKFTDLSSQMARLGCSTSIRWGFEEERQAKNVFSFLRSQLDLARAQGEQIK